VEFQFWPAVIAGFAGGAVMSLAMLMMRKAGKTEMDMALIEGSMVSGDRGTAKAIGEVMHLVVFSALIIGSIYAALFAAFSVEPGNAWWVGALYGVVHGSLAEFSWG
jgi:drug/metabolite transporter (DMT)-like permease